MIAASLKIILNSARKKKDGKAAIYLRVIIQRKSHKIPLKVDWYISHWDAKKQTCKPTQKDDQACNDTNLIIRDNLARATEILVQYRLRRLGLSLETFLKEFHSNLNKENFLVYMEQKMRERVKNGEIELSSKKNHMVTLNHLKKWKKELLFSQLDDMTAHKFEQFLIKKTGSQSINARGGQHRNFKTYLNQARKDKINFIHPYDFFKLKSEMGRFQPMTQAEFLDMWNYYNGLEIKRTDREVLRAFLFACVTGMRHSDIRRMNMDWISGDFFDFIPYKTRRFGTRVRIPVTKEAMALLADELDEVGKEPMFCRISEQKQNKFISDIAKMLDVKNPVCFQVARETFATLYMEKDGKLEVLASFMGHTTTKMSEKYVKIRDQRKREESLRISSFFTLPK
jgi:integrase